MTKKGEASLVVATGSLGYEALVAAESKAVAALSREVAEAIKARK